MRGAHALGGGGDPREVAHAAASDGPTPARAGAWAARRDAHRPGRCVRVSLAAGVDAPAAARAAVTAWMAGHVSQTMLADAQLLVSELVANSVRHADAPADAVVNVRAQARADILRLELEDRGSTGSITRRPPDLDHGGGFGLNVVDTLSARWGVNREGGTRVWAEIAFSAAG
jgi:serine/threonine-protein kinase RsbW